MNEPLEHAYRTFEANDVEVEAFLSLDEATLDNDAFTKLQEKARKGSLAAKGKAAEALSKLVEGIPSSMVLDGVVASAFDGAERYADALELRRQALLLAPAWHPLDAPRLLGNIGFDLIELGELDGALRWLERARTYDPLSPFVLESLAEVHLARGELERAFSLRDALDAMKIPKAHSADFDAEVKSKKLKRPPAVPKMELDFAGIRALSDVGFARLSTTLLFDRNVSEVEALRALTLGCAMRGDLAHALVTARMGAEAEWTGFSERAPLEKAWSRAHLAALERRVGAHDDDPRLSPDAERRFQHLVERVAAKDREALRTMVHDPNPTIRLMACAHLLEAPADPFAQLVVQTQAAMEHKRGIDTRAITDVGVTATSTLRTRRLQDAAPQPLLLVPSEGADHPVFDELGKDEGLLFWLTFPGPVTPEDAAKVNQALVAAAKRASVSDPKAQVHQDTDGVTLQLTMTQCRKDPRGVVRAVIEEFAGAGTNLREIVVGRFVLPKKNDRSIQAVDDPRMSQEGYDDDDERFEASLDVTKTAPLSEPEGGLFMMMPKGEGHVAELRLMQTFFPDVRVVYGLSDVDDDEPSPRSAEVAAAIARALHTSFRGAPPELFDKKEQRGAVVDAIRKGPRRGYAFALSGLTADMVQHYPRSFRFREHELFSGLRAAIHALDLAPTIHWYRGEGTWIVNLWEKA